MSELHSLENFELCRDKYYDIFSWSTISTNQACQIIFQACSSNFISSFTIDSHNIRTDVDIIGLCLDYLKNLEVLTFVECFFTAGLGISEKIYFRIPPKNKLKKLKLMKCQIHLEHLESFVELFPSIEEFTMNTCNENHRESHEPESLLTILKIMSGFKNLKKLKLLHFHCKAEHDMNPDETFR